MWCMHVYVHVTVPLCHGSCRSIELARGPVSRGGWPANSAPPSGRPRAEDSCPQQWTSTSWLAHLQVRPTAQCTHVMHIICVSHLTTVGSRFVAALWAASSWSCGLYSFMPVCIVPYRGNLCGINFVISFKIKKCIRDFVIAY